MVALLSLSFVAAFSTRPAAADQCSQCGPNYFACVNAAPNDPVWRQACLQASNQCIARYCQ
jgi:hypothetical protein